MIPEASFWERRPWLGAGVFGVVAAGVGTFLALTVGERPHFRQFEAPLVIERPNMGTFPPDAPWARDPVGIHVRVRVTDGRGEPLPDVPVVLVWTGPMIRSSAQVRPAYRRGTCTFPCRSGSIDGGATFGWGRSSRAGASR